MPWMFIAFTSCKALIPNYFMELGLGIIIIIIIIAMNNCML